MYTEVYTVFTLSSIKFIYVSSIVKYGVRIRIFKEFVFIFIAMKAFFRFIDRQYNYYKVVLVDIRLPY